jgi:hypothetical protein
MLRAVLDTGGPVGVLPQRVPLPPVLGGVVDLHGRTLLLAHPFVVEVLAGLNRKATFNLCEKTLTKNLPFL